jgi:uncharacterized protein (TIGR01777 family)
MKILISGATGLVGTALSNRLQQSGHTAIQLRRGDAGGEPQWNPEAGSVELGNMNGIDAVVHLAGENIVAGRWTAARKDRIRNSRTRGTQLLSEALAESQHKPAVLISASAVGFYGDRGDETLTEASPAGSGYLSEVCQGWEDATRPAEEAGIRTVHARIGIVLSRNGGALKKMLGPFKMGAGGILGDGKQMMSWVTIGDVVSMLIFAIESTSLREAVNFVSPAAVSNREFTKALGCVLHRPTVAPMPAFAARLLFGEMADALLLSGAKVVPGKLQDAGYQFQHSTIEEGLRAVL